MVDLRLYPYLFRYANPYAYQPTAAHTPPCTVGEAQPQVSWLLALALALALDGLGRLPALRGQGSL